MILQNRGLSDKLETVNDMAQEILPCSLTWPYDPCHDPSFPRWDRTSCNKNNLWKRQQEPVQKLIRNMVIELPLLHPFSWLWAFPPSWLDYYNSPLVVEEVYKVTRDPRVHLEDDAQRQIAKYTPWPIINDEKADFGMVRRWFSVLSKVSWQRVLCKRTTTAKTPNFCNR